MGTFNETNKENNFENKIENRIKQLKIKYPKKYVNPNNSKEKKYFIEDDTFKQISEKDKKIFVITGPNGIGKSYFLKTLLKGNWKTQELKSDDINKNNINYKTKNGSWFKDLVRIDLNKELKESIKNNFNELNKRFINSYNKMFENLKFIENKNKAMIWKKNDEKKIKKIISILNDFLENKEIKQKLNNDSNKMLLKDNHCPEEDSEKILNNDSLSSGEKNLFAIASIFLEVKQKNKRTIYIWDEIETTFHPRWQQKILDFFKVILGNSILICSTHSSHIALKSHLDQEIKLLTLNRRNNVFELKKANLNNNEFLKEYLNLGKDFEAFFSKIKFPTLFVEGLSDEIFLKPFLKDVSIQPMEGSHWAKHINKGYKFLAPNDNIIILLDNDDKDFKYQDNYFLKTKRIHYLNDLKKEKSIEYYFEDILSQENEIQIKKDKIINIINLENINNFYFDEKEFNSLKKNLQKKIEKKINKIGFLDSNFKTNEKIEIIKKCDKEKKPVYLPSKIEIANWLIENKKNKVEKKLFKLIKSIKQKFET